MWQSPHIEVKWSGMNKAGKIILIVISALMLLVLVVPYLIPVPPE